MVNQHNSTLPEMMEGVLNVLKVSTAEQLSEWCLADSSKNPLFSSQNVPVISIVDYLGRIIRYFKCSPSVYVVMRVYLERFLQISKLSPFNVHRVCGVLSVLAVKYLEDDYFSNRYYAEVLGLELPVLNQLELLMLVELEFDVHVTEEVFNQCFYRMLDGQEAEVGHDAP